MKFAVRRLVLLAVIFHVLAFLYVAELLHQRRIRDIHDNHIYVASLEEEAELLARELKNTSETHDDPTMSTVDVVQALSVDEKIQGIEALLVPSYKELMDHRDRWSKKDTTVTRWRDIHPGANRIHGEDYSLLKVLKNEFPQVITLPVVVDVDEVKPFLLPYYFHIGSTNCKAAVFSGRGPENVLKWFYNATCKPYIADTLRPVPFSMRSRSLRIWNYAGFLKDPAKILITYLNLVPNAVVDKYGDISTVNMTLVPQRCDPDKGWGPRDPLDTLPHYREVFTIQQKNGREPARSTLESLARLAPFVGFLRDHPQIRIHAGYANPLLDLLTIMTKRVVPDSTRTSMAYVPAGTHCNTPALFTTQLMSYYLRQGLHNQPEARDVVLLLKDPRRTSSKEYMALYQEVQQFVETEGKKRSLMVLEYTDLIQNGLASTRELFNRAIIIIAVTPTPSLANMYFSQPGTVVLEGLCQPPNLMYAAFAQTLGLRYYAVLGQGGCEDLNSASQFKSAIRFYLSRLDLIRISSETAIK